MESKEIMTLEPCILCEVEHEADGKMVDLTNAYYHDECYDELPTQGNILRRGVESMEKISDQDITLSEKIMKRTELKRKINNLLAGLNN